jgi:hypothetical protein
MRRGLRQDEVPMQAPTDVRGRSAGHLMTLIFSLPVLALNFLLPW